MTLRADRPSAVAVVLAAGAGSRFGGCKQLALLDGKPLLAHALESAAAGPATETVLVLGARARRIEAELDLTGVSVVRADDWELGPQASLAAGLRSLGGDVGAALVTLGDEVRVPPAAAGRLMARRRHGIPGLRATYGGRVGHPVLIERELFAPLIQLATGPQKPGRVLREAGVQEIECGDLGRPVDVDTPGQLALLAS
jgi:CTP:molybdopterin cytidylyltransferase MocA